jgi:hypothetical protein
VFVSANASVNTVVVKNEAVTEDVCAQWVGAWVRGGGGRGAEWHASLALAEGVVPFASQ